MSDIDLPKIKRTVKRGIVAYSQERASQKRSADMVIQYPRATDNGYTFVLCEDDSKERGIRVRVEIDTDTILRVLKNIFDRKIKKKNGK